MDTNQSSPPLTLMFAFNTKDKFNQANTGGNKRGNHGNGHGAHKALLK